MKLFAFIFVMSLLCAAGPETGDVKQKPAPPAPAANKPKEMAKAVAAAPSPTKAPKSESLHYNVNWPSGLTLGEATISSSSSDAGVSSSFQLDASIPGFAIVESAKSNASPDFCSIELSKNGVRGKRKVDEKTEFDSKKLQATRSTVNGGKSELSTAACAKDALTFVQFLRKELAGGRLPQQQKIYYGAPYSVRVTFAGTQEVKVGGEAVQADKLLATVKGPASETTAELFFAKDAGRTPLLVQIPLAMGKFSMELIR